MIGVGGQVSNPDAGPPGSGGDEGLSTYKDITIEVSPQTSLELEEVLSYIGNSVEVEVINPTLLRRPPPNGTAGQVKAGLLQSLQGGPIPPPRGGAGGGGGPLP